jgi:uncharacterized protein YoxC
MQIDVIALIAVFLVLLIVIFLIPTLLQVKATAQRMDELIRESQRDLIPMLRDLREASERLNRTTAKAEEGVEKASGLMDSVGEVGETIGRFNEFLNYGVGRTTGNALGLWLGIRAASKVLLRQLKQQTGGD